MLCCDVSHKVLRMQTVYELLKDIVNIRVAVQKALLGAFILTRYNNKCYRVDDIDWEMTPSSTFTDYNEVEKSFFTSARSITTSPSNTWSSPCPSAEPRGRWCGQVNRLSSWTVQLDFADGPDEGGLQTHEGCCPVYQSHSQSETTGMYYSVYEFGYLSIKKLATAFSCPKSWFWRNVVSIFARDRVFGIQSGNVFKSYFMVFW